MRQLSRRMLHTATLSLPFIGKARSAEPIRMRCSLDTAPGHGRNLSVADYLKKVEAASDGRIRTELFSSGQLFADLNVSKALIQGQVDMAAPGTWAITSFIQNADVLQLPALYDQPIAVIHRVTDGRVGALIGQDVASKLRSRVLGPWIDNGFTNWYTTRKPLSSVADLKGLKIRNSGGVAQSWRTRFFDAIPNVTAWPDVPLALSQGTFDGLMTTNESIASVKLWEAGVRYSLQDHSSFAAYVPMLSNNFWSSLTPDLQTLVTDLWAQNIGTYRSNMAESQARALQTLQSQGITVVDVSAAQASTLRREMMKDQDQLARDLRITPEMMAALEQDVAGAI